jgi:hypothetical protein
MYKLYSKYIHFNEYDKTWNAFERSEQGHYLNDRSKMKTLETYDTIEELLEAHKIEKHD